ncbi:MAG: RNA polymerase sigma factor [Bacteroidetes bacterium]|nr:MAG: RNA polymerase sigma factor [Bacteroidota bacterium]
MESWDNIYINNAPKMLGICRRYVKDIQLAEDLVQEAFMTAMDKVNTYSGKGSFEGWLRRIVINTALQYLRKNKNIVFTKPDVLEYQTQAPEDSQESEDAPESERSTIESGNFSQQELLETIDELPEHHKAVFNLYVIDEYTHKEIGKMLNISAGTSKSHLARARKKIQQMLFEKAQKKKEDKSRKGFFWFLFSPKPDYIDKLYKDAFKSFEIQPQNLTSLKGGSQLVNTQQSFSILKAFIGNKLLLVSSIGLVTVASVYFLYPKDAPVQKEDVIETITKKVEEQIKIEPSANTNIISTDQKDTLPIEKDPITTPAKIAKSVNNNKKTNAVVKKPVVIHKQVIKRDTVIKRVPVSNK